MACLGGAPMGLLSTDPAARAEINMKLTSLVLATAVAVLVCGVGGAAQAGACVHRPAPAGTAGKRVAMIIGNGAYSNGLPALANPARDAEATAKAVGALGFEVFLATDADGAALGQCLDQAYAGAADADVALFYYSGHGIQIKDENYLVATDAAARDLAHGLVPVQPVVDALQARAKATLVVLDACRNNPMAADGPAGLSVSTGRGLARIKDAEPAPAPAATVQARGLMVAYSTSPNAVAVDGTGTLSPFTAAFVKAVGTSGYSVQRVMSDVTKAVGEETDWTQTPWMKSSLTDELKLGGGQTLDDARAVSDNHAARSATLLDTDGNREGAVVEALKGLPPTPDAAALERFPKAYLALYAAVQSPEVKLPLTPGQTQVAVSTRHRVAVFRRAADFRSGEFTLWNAADQSIVAKPDVGKDVYAFTFSPHGKLLAVVTEGGVTVLDGIDGSRLFALRGRATRAEFSPDESRLLLVGDDVLTVVDLAAMKPMAVLKGGQLDLGARRRRSADVAQAMFGSNDTVCYILSLGDGNKGVLGVFDLRANKATRLRETDESVTVTLCDPAGKYMVRTFAVGSGQQGMEIWDLAADTVTAVKAPIVNILGIDPKGDYVSVIAFDNAAQGFYDLAAGRKGHPPTVPDGYVVIGARVRNASGGLVSQDVSPNAWRDWPDESLFGPALVEKAVAGLTAAQRDEVARDRITYAATTAAP